MDKRSVQYIQSLNRQVSIKRITAVASLVATIAGAIIFQQPLFF